MPIAPLPITAFSLVTAAGRGGDANYEALVARRSGLTANDTEFADVRTYVGRVKGIEACPVVEALRFFDCRNNRLAQMALRENGFESSVAAARARYGAARVAVILGTSTSGIAETERAYRTCDSITGVLPSWYSYEHSHDIFSLSNFVHRYLDLCGPSYVISTACSSSAKVFASAHRLIQAGLCDAAVVGGVDSLCGTTLYGFSSLQIVSQDVCRPCDVARDGISIGEAAGFALLEQDPSAGGDNIALLGFGESTDAYHMSSPHPDGLGAKRAMMLALHGAGLKPSDIDYINMHGTASKANDAAEDRAIHAVFGSDTPCSSTKGWTGHTLGAAGITEALLSVLCLRQGLIPGTLNTISVDPEFQINVVLDNRAASLQRIMSNSFGFGGNNCCIVLGMR